MLLTLAPHEGEFASNAVARPSQHQRASCRDPFWEESPSGSQSGSITRSMQNNAYTLENAGERDKHSVRLSGDSDWKSSCIDSVPLQQQLDRHKECEILANEEGWHHVCRILERVHAACQRHEPRASYKVNEVFWGLATLVAVE